MIIISQKTRQTLEKKEKDQSGAVREIYLKSFDPDLGIEVRTTNRLLLRFEFNIKGRSQLQDEVRQVGRPKMSTFCQRSYHRKCQRRGLGGQKKPKSCKRSL